MLFFYCWKHGKTSKYTD